MSGDQLDLDAIERTAGRMYEALRSHGYGAGLGTLSRDVPALVAEVRRLRGQRATAWDEGHETPWRRGQDDCQCSAWNRGECGCGEYGTGELLSLAQNPYRDPA